MSGRGGNRPQPEVAGQWLPTATVSTPQPSAADGAWELPDGAWNVMVGRDWRVTSALCLPLAACRLPETAAPPLRS